jgi:hypothetical protein
MATFVEARRAAVRFARGAFCGVARSLGSRAVHLMLPAACCGTSRLLTQAQLGLARSAPSQRPGGLLTQRLMRHAQGSYTCCCRARAPARCKQPGKQHARLFHAVPCCERSVAVRAARAAHRAHAARECALARAASTGAYRDATCTCLPVPSRVALTCCFSAAGRSSLTPCDVRAVLWLSRPA